MRTRNPEAVRVLVGWAIVAIAMLGLLALMGFLPPHPGFGTVFLPGVVAVFLQGGVAMMVVRSGRTRLAWWVLLLPPALAVLGLPAFFVMFAVGIN